MKALTVTFITARPDSRLSWFLDSLAKQHYGNNFMDVIVVDAMSEGRQVIPVRAFEDKSVTVTFTGPKPTIWQGEHRITSVDWWAKSNSLNSSICLCRTEWIAFVDDRCVLMPGWLDCIREAMNENYAVCGTYEKRANIKVVGGVISDPGELLGADHRPQVNHTLPTHDFYGGHCALPLEWCLRVNGYAEKLCDGLGSEDSCFGITLRNSGYPMRYDPRMKIVEDRTPGEIDGALKRADKGISPNDKSHKIIEIIRDKTTSQNEYDIRNLRDRILNGEPFPPPCDSHFDWYDQQPISEMT